MKSRTDSQLSFGPVATSKMDAASGRASEIHAAQEAAGDRRAIETQDSVLRPKETHEADALAASIFDEALTAARITSGEAAYLLGVSESVVNRMRSPNARERVNLRQLLLLPPQFHIAFHRVMNRRYGFGRAALSRLLEDLGIVATSVAG